MEARPLLITLQDNSAGYEISPERVPLATLRGFSKDVDEFLRGDDGEVDTSALDVSVVAGSLGLRTAPMALPSLLNDLRRFATGEELSGLSAKRRTVVERWQKAARGQHRSRVEITAAFLARPIVIDQNSDYHLDDADQWVRVERYVRGEIEDMGGHSRPNAHVRLPDGKLVVVDATREVLREERTNRLYEPGSTTC